MIFIWKLKDLVAVIPAIDMALRGFACHLRWLSWFHYWVFIYVLISISLLTQIAIHELFIPFCCYKQL